MISFRDLDKERNEAKKEADLYLGRVIRMCLKKKLNFSITHSGCDVIYIHDENQEFNYSSYFSLNLSGYSDGTTVKMIELYNLIKNYKK